MADFRKLFVAFAGVALFLGSNFTAKAQTVNTNQAFACTANAGQPPIVRAEGVTELVGDVVLNCSGGTPTAVGQPIPLYNIQIFLNTNVTSRLYANSISDALLLIDEPYPSGAASPTNATQVSNAPQTQRGCVANGIPTNGFQSPCEILGVGTTGNGGTPGIGPVGNNGPYNGAVGRYNIFQGVQAATNSIAWLGVPVDSPGTTAVNGNVQFNTRTIRITNVRGNACLLGVSSTLVPTTLSMLISVNGAFPIQSPSQVVGYIQQGLTTVGTNRTLTQCINFNAGLLGGSGGTTGTIPLVAREGFASSFKPRSFGQYYSAGTQLGFNGTFFPDSSVALQNVPGYSYYSESGFVTAATGLTNSGTTAGSIGLADTGTEFTVNFANIGSGLSMFLPSVIFLYPTTNIGSGGVIVTGSNPTGVAVLVGSTGTSATTTQVTVSGTAATATYEVLFSNPNVIEAMSIPVSVAYISNTSSNIPALGTGTAGISFAPISSTPTASTTNAPIPRFCASTTPANLFTINPCTCNLLFPFVTNQAGFDTGIAIANTSLDPFGTATQTGNVTLNYYGGTVGGGAAPAAFTTSGPVPPGQELVFTLSNGGNLGMSATPGFQGYIIASSRFQYCHGFAFISDLGAQRLAEGYLAIEIDVPGLYRTGVSGESAGH